MVLLCHAGTKNIMFDNTVINKSDFSFLVSLAIIGAHWEKVQIDYCVITEGVLRLFSYGI